MGMTKIDPMIRFRKKFKRQRNGCWKWIGGGNGTGYGLFSFRGQSMLAHRMSWILFNGPIPDDMLVCHHCDKPGCVNPEHLFIGTRSDNMQDCARKGRLQPKHDPETVPRGDNHWTHRHPEKVLTGANHWMRKHPEKIPRGATHYTRKRKVKMLHDKLGRFVKGVRY